VNHYLYSMLALELARERSQEAEQRWLESRLVTTRPSRTSRIRRMTARLVASVSLGSAAIVRRLDSCVADDLGRTMAPAE
jgi:hypothetical protein